MGVPSLELTKRSRSLVLFGGQLLLDLIQLVREVGEDFTKSKICLLVPWCAVSILRLDEFSDGQNF